MMFRPALPHRLPAVTNAEVSKYFVSLSSVRPESVAVSTLAPGAQLARDAVEPKNAAPLESVMLNGEPVWNVVIPPSCQPLKNFFPNAVSFRPNPQAGIPYTYENVKRCRRSKSDTA